MIRLQCYLSNELSVHPGDAPPLLSCVLHSGELAQGHQLEAWVGGINQTFTPEGEQEIATWQCAAEVEMEIHLRQHQRTVKAWRGWWKGERIVHGGTLALQVWLRDEVQPAMSAQPSPRFAPLPQAGTVDLRNGTSTLHPPHLAAAALAVLDAPTSQPTVSVEEEGDLWDVELATSRSEARQEETRERQEQVLEDRTEQEYVPPLLDRSQRAGAEGEQSAGSPTLAALHAPFAVSSHPAHEQSLQHLADLLASMPATTVLVDLRKHATVRRARAHQNPAWGLTKETLRALYGARYWERGGSIPITLHQGPTHPARWHIVISDPRAEGLMELCAHLAQGGSLLLLDSLIPYEESERAAVITFLHARFPQASVGACS